MPAVQIQQEAMPGVGYQDKYQTTTSSTDGKPVS
ncbi:hypothetical protein LYNGBM3L_46100 [Moorena producens 3L]|uniref:Uncharacterized protein n=1 Tax=Moorena producens 3L TaxID=489825 RepID=F4XWV0_9CYAN|nr:hypothetical protein LYNGBM3L_46100 [Moorena producens 3L]